MDGDEIVYEFGDDEPELVHSGIGRLTGPIRSRLSLVVVVVVSLALGAVGLGLWRSHSDDQHRRGAADVVLTLLQATSNDDGTGSPDARTLQMTISVANTGPVPVTLLGLDPGNAPMRSLGVAGRLTISSGKSSMYTLAAVPDCGVISTWNPAAPTSYFAAEVKTADGVTHTVHAALNDQQGQLLSTMSGFCSAPAGGPSSGSEAGVNTSMMIIYRGAGIPAVHGDTIAVPVQILGAPGGRAQTLTMDPQQMPGLRSTFDRASISVPSGGKADATLNITVTDCSQVSVTLFTDGVMGRVAALAPNTGVDGSLQSAIALGVGEVCGPRWRG